MNAACLMLCLALGPTGEKELSIAHVAVYRSNVERVKEGLAPLKLGEKEMAAAMWMAQDQAKDQLMRHIDSLGRDFPERVKFFGVEDPTGENCAAGQPTPERVITSWLGSPKHRTNMLRKDAKWIGVGYAPADGTYRHYWTMVLSRGPSYPAIIENEAPTIDRDEVSLFIHGEGVVTKIRIANDGGEWSDWMPYQSVVNWTLSPGKGVKKVSVEMMDASGRTRTAVDDIQRN